MSARVVSLAQLEGLVGQEIGVSEPLVVSQERIRQFAEATGDHQWIHLDPERTARESPFKAPVAHGYLTLSLLPALRDSALEITGARMIVNYGSNRVRFPSPLRAGGTIRGSFALAAYEPIEGGVQLTFRITVTEVGASKPCCAAEVLTRCYT